MKHILDVSTFEVQEYPNHEIQRILADKGIPWYTVYLYQAYAISEVTYFNLCEILEIPCVRSFYGKNLVSEEITDKLFPSVSAYSHKWKNLGEKSVETAENASDFNRHLITQLLIRHTLNIGETEDLGYITQDNKFLTANNGATFSPISLNNVFKNRKDVFPPTNLEKEDFEYEVDANSLEDGIDILDKIIKITPEQLQTIIEIPDEIDNKKAVQGFLLNKLETMKKYAEQFK